MGSHSLLITSRAVSALALLTQEIAPGYFRPSDWLSVRLVLAVTRGVLSWAVLSPCQLDVGGAVIDTNFHVAFPYVD